jgi:hypothetical protein
MRIIHGNQFHRLEAAGNEPDDADSEGHWFGWHHRPTTLPGPGEQRTDGSELESLIRAMQRELQAAYEAPVALAPAWLGASECA